MPQRESGEFLTILFSLKINNFIQQTSERLQNSILKHLKAYFLTLIDNNWSVLWKVTFAFEGWSILIFINCNTFKSEIIYDGYSWNFFDTINYGPVTKCSTAPKLQGSSGAVPGSINYPWYATCLIHYQLNWFVFTCIHRILLWDHLERILISIVQSIEILNPLNLPKGQNIFLIWWRSADQMALLRPNER